MLRRTATSLPAFLRPKTPRPSPLLFNPFRAHSTRVSTSGYVNQVLTFNGQKIPTHIDLDETTPLKRAILVKSDDNQVLGRLDYLPWEGHLFLSHMENASKYRIIMGMRPQAQNPNVTRYHQVGSLLHEHGFRESMRFGFGGDVRLMTGYSSHLFHFGDGFRPYPEVQFKFSPMLCQELGFSDLRDKFFKNPEDKETEAQIIERMTKSQLHERLLRNTQRALGRKPQEIPSLREIMKYGFHEKINLTQAWQAALAANTNKPLLDTHAWGSFEMRLPAETIQAKKKRFGFFERLSLAPQNLASTPPDKTPAFRPTPQKGGG